MSIGSSAATVTAVLTKKLPRSPGRRKNYVVTTEKDESVSKEQNVVDLCVNKTGIWVCILITYLTVIISELFDIEVSIGRTLNDDRHSGFI